jgi:predicted signal transduction protein with EAL and GGDEF domain
MAEALGLSTVCEGVEDVATMALVRSVGLDEIQGFVFSRPVPLPELLAWAGSGHREMIMATLPPAPNRSAAGATSDSFDGEPQRRNPVRDLM